MNVGRRRHRAIVTVSVCVAATVGGGAVYAAPATAASSDFATYSQAVLAQNPTAYYPLNDTGGPTVQDVSGNGNNASYAGTLTYDLPGVLPDNSVTAVGANGDSGFIQGSDLAPLEGSSNRTVELWFKSSRAGNLFHAGTAGHVQDFDIATLANGSPGGCGSPSGIGLYVRFWDDDLAFPNLNLTDNKWHYVAVTVSNSGSTVNVVVDGQQPPAFVWNGSCYAASAQSQPFAMPYAVDTASAPFYLAASDWAGGFAGSLNLAAIYPTALPSSVLQAHYSLGEGNGMPSAILGLGDSVAAGYGLSQAAEWNSGFLSSRFPGGDAGCDLTPNAYPCVVAQSLNGTQEGSNNYAVQGATSDQVLSNELPLAESTTTAQRASVTIVTLTVGANDINFSGCLSDEFQFKTDHCLAGNINNLLVSPSTSAHLKHLASNLQQIFARIHADFPNAAIDVTGYYQPFPPPPSSGSDACPVFTVPALAALQSQQGIGLAAILAYLKNLPQFESEFQTRFYIVSSFQQGQLDQVIQGAATAAQVAGLPVRYIDLSSTFNGHDICQGAHSWVFAPRLIADIAAILNVDYTFGTPTCPDPAPALEGSEVQKTIFHDSLGFAIFYSNCIPHPLQVGQRAIASAITAG